jgi:hypothetical protein
MARCAELTSRLIPDCDEADVGSLKKALLFEKRSKNYCSFGVRVGATLTPYKQKFFSSFSQKRTACFLLPAQLLVAIRCRQELPHADEGILLYYRGSSGTGLDRYDGPGLPGTRCNLH